MTELYAIEAKEEDYLYIKESQITNAGLGLYTAIKLQKGDIIAVYKGIVLSASVSKSTSELNDDTFFMNLPNGKTLDCKPVAGFAKMANDCLNSGFKQNAIITMDEHRVVLVAQKTIHSNEEIFTSYGKKYWEAKLK